jgi:hypothetical protein
VGVTLRQCSLTSKGEGSLRPLMPQLIATSVGQCGIGRPDSESVVGPIAELLDWQSKIGGCMNAWLGS